MTQNNKNIFHILLFFAMIGWGATWVNAKILSEYINEFEMVFLRIGITALTMIPIILVLKKSFKIDIKTFLLVCVSALVMIFYMKYYFLGTKLGTASLGGAFVTTLVPINTFLILVLMRSKTIAKKDMFALGLGVIGVLTMLNAWALKAEDIFVLHNLYFIFASILWPVLTILSSKSRNISPIVFTFYLYIVVVVLDVLFFVDISNIAYESFDSRFWLNIFVITIAGSTFANTIYFLGVEKLGASEVSSFIFLVPFSAIALSVIFLGEEIGINVIIGTVLTLFAVKILNNIKLFKSKT
ncbi:MAG: DMT family transporter [Campylobacteraceae bacterium]|nr:DMT family transporter [Campylobacteraceae bacterium]